jgi:hypothetical protein
LLGIISGRKRAGLQPLVFQRQKKCSVTLRPNAPKIHQTKHGVRQKIALIPIATPDPLGVYSYSDAGCYVEYFAASPGLDSSGFGSSRRVDVRRVADVPPFYDD